MHINGSRDVQWGLEYQTRSVFKWSKDVGILNGSLLERHSKLEHPNYSKMDQYVSHFAIYNLTE